MYQSLALAPNPGQSTTYSHDSSNFLHSPTSSAVYVPTSRVPSMLQSLPYLQSCESAHQSHPLSSHPGWAQTASAEASHFNASSPHPPSGFSYSHSPPGGNGGGREGSYQSPLLLGTGGRDQYGNTLVRSVSGSYSSPYPGAYMSPAEMAPSWTAGHFESSVLHSLQTRQGTLPGRRSTFGMYMPPFLVEIIPISGDSWPLENFQLQPISDISFLYKTFSKFQVASCTPTWYYPHFCR